MKTLPVPLFVVMALVAGGATGALTSVLVRPLGPQASPTPVLTPASGERELAARVDALAAENQALRERLSVLEVGPAVATRAPVVGVGEFVAQDEFQAFREEVEAWLAGFGGMPRESEVFKEHVADALSTIRKDEKVQAVRGYQETREARLDQDIAKLEEKLGLSPYQSNGMRTALLAQYDRENEVRRLWEEGGDDELISEHKTRASETFQSDLQAILSPQQLEDFWTEVRRGGK